VAHRWRDWQDPRFVVCVFNNQELTEVTWEQRESEAEPRFAASQELPDFPFAGYADLLGLKGIRVEDPERIADAWDQAFAADCPVVIEVLTDPEIPLLPPFPAGRQKAESMRKGLAAEDDGGRASALLDTYVSHEERREG
jgi:pyruvate dehydrogenase (quinone)